jgi:hypothetical protein
MSISARCSLCHRDVSYLIYHRRRVVVCPHCKATFRAGEQEGARQVGCLVMSFPIALLTWSSYAGLFGNSTILQLVAMLAGALSGLFSGVLIRKYYYR